MTKDPEIKQIHAEVQRARENLSQTLEEVNRKVEDQLHLELLVLDQPLKAAGIAAGAGLVLGLTSKSALMAVATWGLAIYVGYSMIARYERSSDGAQ